MSAPHRQRINLPHIILPAEREGSFSPAGIERGHRRRGGVGVRPIPDDRRAAVPELRWQRFGCGTECEAFRFERSGLNGSGPEPGAVVIDGLLVGLGAVLGAAQGIIITVALTLEILFLSLSLGRSSPKPA